MTAAAIAVEGFVPIRRVRNGEVVEAELFVGYHPDTHALAIGEGWKARSQTFRDLDGYLLTEFETQVPGRAFKLVRSPFAVAKDPERVSHYSLLIGSESTCDCRGFAATSKQGRTCKHISAVRWLIQEGHLGEDSHE